MHHNENDRWQHHREQRHQQQHEEQQRQQQHEEQQRRQQHPYREDNINDFTSRWGEPSPLSGRRDEWQAREESYSRRGRHPRYRKEWLPDQQRQQHDPQRQQYDNRASEWQQQDTRYNPDNQNANDRWLDDPYLPHPQDRRSNRQFPFEDNRDDRRW